MSESLDNSAINQLIPEIFDQMRHNAARTRDAKKPSAMVEESGSITTQSLLRELETLDKVIATIRSIDSVVKGALPSHMNKIHHVCKSTNKMLDNWINIQSQAGYAHHIMDSRTGYKTGSNSNEEVVEQYKQEIAELQKSIKMEEDKLIPAQVKGNGNGPTGQRLYGNSYRQPTGRVTKATALRNARNRPSGIPQISSRLTRPTASSNLKRQR
ncbi:DASH complex subunit Duo1 [Nakaseomyces glabratus]